MFDPGAGEGGEVEVGGAGGGDVDGGAGVGEGAVGVVEGDGAVGVQAELPAAFVDVVVVSGAEGEEVVEVGGAALADPGDDVVDLTITEPDGAAGNPQVRYIARNARRWSAVATRRPRPWSSTAPSASRTVGRMVASQAIRRIVSGGTGCPSEVSHTEWGWRPSARVAWSMSTDTSAGRRPPALRGAVVRVTKASARSWSNVRDASPSA